VDVEKEDEDEEESDEEEGEPEDEMKEACIFWKWILKQICTFVRNLNLHH